MRPAVGGRARGRRPVGQRPGDPAVSHARRDHAVRVHGKKERWPRHPVRVHGLAAHLQDDGRAQGQTVAGHILPEAPAQQPAQAAGVRVLGHGHPTPDHTQQHAGRRRGIVTQLHR